MDEYIKREAVRALFNGAGSLGKTVNSIVDSIPTADVVEVDKVAELLLLSFGGDACACNFNGNDEWLWEKCKYAETECPTPKDELGCWKEFVKAMLAKMDGRGDS